MGSDWKPGHGWVGSTENLGQSAGHVTELAGPFEQLIHVGSHLFEVTQQRDHLVIHRLGELR